MDFLNTNCVVHGLQIICSTGDEIYLIYILLICQKERKKERTKNHVMKNLWLEQKKKRNKYYYLKPQKRFTLTTCRNERELDKKRKKDTIIYTYICTQNTIIHTHTHTHSHIYIYIYMYTKHHYIYIQHTQKNVVKP